MGSVQFRWASSSAQSLFFVVNFLWRRSSWLSDPVNVAHRAGRRPAKGFGTGVIALAPLAWLMARVYQMPDGGWWATLLFAVPLYSTRVAFDRFIELREMFTQTIGALAEAVDKRDPYTAKHSQRVKDIAVDIGRVMHVSDSELEALEWGGLLHDVGKIGVPDRVLLKQDRLNKDERMIMNAHPVLGAEIIAPVTKLAPELPIIRHHHEWYNGSGYPDRLIGDEIPKLARVLHVADAFEAMTAARPYRMTPLTNEQALGELRKFAGIQFDPVVVDAFVRTVHVEGVPDAGRTVQSKPIPLIGQAASRLTASPNESPTAPHDPLLPVPSAVRSRRRLARCRSTSPGRWHLVALEAALVALIVVRSRWLSRHPCRGRSADRP